LQKVEMERNTMKNFKFKKILKCIKFSTLTFVLLTLIAWLHAGRVEALPEFPVPGKVTLVNFYADYCFACRMLKPVLEKIAADHGQSLAIVNVDAQNNLERAKKMKVTAVPVLFFYDRDGRLHLRHEGFMKEEKIRAVLEDMGLP